MKNKKIALQMDDIEKIDFDYDTSFLLGYEAQNRGYEVFYYNPHTLEYLDEKIKCSGFNIKFKNKKLDYFKKLHSNIELRELNEFDLVLIRQDPPFNMNYITNTYLLEQLNSKTVVLNDPSSIRNYSEKIYPLQFKEFMAPTILTQSVKSINNFLETYKDIIIKPLYGSGGEGIFRTKANENFINGINQDLEFLSEPMIALKYIPEILEGDRRIILIDGEYVGSVSRVPQKGSEKANFHAGGMAVKTNLIYRDEMICEKLKLHLKKNNLFLVGIDIIGNYLTEINVTSPTGFKQINKLNNTNVQKIFWNKVEEKFF